MNNQTTTLVSCYYIFPSKHSHDKYNIWIHYLLENIKNNIIIFTSSDLVKYFEDIKNINKDLKLKIIIKEFNDLDILKKYNLEFWVNQYKLDPTPTIRTKECFIIWNSKMNFIKEAIEINPFNSDKFIWNDIGSMRDLDYSKKINKYPIYNNISNDKLDIILVKKYDKEQYFFQNETHLSGAIFGTSKHLFLKIIDLYYKYFDLYIKNNLFIGCDQQILSTLYMNHKDLFNLIIPDNNSIHNNSIDNNIIDKWFYLYHHYTL